jgi:hypothetical protein
MAKTNHARPWERQPGETDAEFQAFQVYRDMTAHGGAYEGQGRNLKKLHKLLQETEGKQARSAAMLGEWHKFRDWKRRCYHFDLHMDSVVLKTTERTLREMRERHIKLAMKMQKASFIELSKLVDQVIRKAKRDPEAISAKELVRFAEIGVKLERLSRGESTEVVKGKLDLSALALGELKQLKALRNKAKKS